MQSLHIKRSPCKGSFDRSNIQPVAGIPQSEILSVVDKVELTAENFKFRKGLKIFACILLAIALGFVACGVTRALAAGRHGPRGPWGHQGVVPGNSHLNAMGPNGPAAGFGHHGRVPRGFGGRGHHGFGGRHRFHHMKKFWKRFAKRFHRGFKKGFRGMKHRFGGFGRMRHHRFGGFRGMRHRFGGFGMFRKHHEQKKNPNFKKDQKNEKPEGPVPTPTPAPAPAKPDVTMIPTDPANKPTGEVVIQAPAKPSEDIPTHIKDPEAPARPDNKHRPAPQGEGSGPSTPTPAPSDVKEGPAEQGPRRPHHLGGGRPDLKQPTNQSDKQLPPQDAKAPHHQRPDAQGAGVKENQLPSTEPAVEKRPEGPLRSQGMRRGFHHGKRRGLKHLLIFLILPLLILIGMRCKARRAAKKVRALLEIENRYFGPKYGYIWTVDKKLTELSLVPVTPVAQQPETQVAHGYHMQYPPMMAPHHPAHMLPAHQGAPLYTENSPRPASPRGAFAAPRGGYQRVSLDDSTVGYTYK